MAIPSTGAISLDTIQTEFGGTNPISLNEYYAGGSFVANGVSGTNGAVPSSGQISIGSFYGTSKPAPAGQAAFTSPGTYSWTAPAGVTSVSVVVVSGAGADGTGYLSKYDGGALSYKNNITVTPNTSYTVQVGTQPCSNGSWFFSNTTVRASGRNTRVGDGGGDGGCAFNSFPYQPGAGAGGYAGSGGNGGYSTGGCGAGGGGGGSARGGGAGAAGGGGGGVGLLGQGASGAVGVTSGCFPGGWKIGTGGGGGSGGASGYAGFMIACYFGYGGAGGAFGGGGGGGGNVNTGGCQISQLHASGAVRLIWAGDSGISRSFPSTNTGDL